MNSDPSATQVLMFHRVMDDVPVAFGLPSCYRLRGTALTFDEFEEVLVGLGSVLPLRVVEHALEAGVAPPPGSVLTFDDGYREHLDRVAPALVARGVSATFYVATGLHGGGSAVAAVDAWYWLLDHAVRRQAVVPMPDGTTFSGRIDTLAGKATWVGGPPKVALLSATPWQQGAMLIALAEAVACPLPTGLADQLYLRPEEWAVLVELGMRVGAHSVTHPRLPQLDDIALDLEVASSVAGVRSLGEAVSFAYPDGAVDQRVVGAVKRCEVSSAVTCEVAAIGASSSRFRLPRIFVRPPVEA